MITHADQPPDDPAASVEQIRRQLAAVRGDAGLRSELLLRLAETYQQQGQVFSAWIACSDAASTAVALPVGDPRHSVVLGVGADVAVCDGHLAAVQACDAYLSSTAQQDWPDVRRVVLAGALLATAVYHREGCEQGRRILRRALCNLPADNRPIAITILNGLQAMREGCRPHCQLPFVDVPPAMPGGMLHPGIDAPPAGYLAHRVRLHPPRRHTCEFGRQ